MPKCLLIDGNNIIFRSYYAFQRQNLKTSTGQPTTAVYGFTKMLVNLLQERKPDLVAVAFDMSRDTFRKKLYPAYKAKRKPTPEDLIQQIPLAWKIVEKLGIAILKNPNYEADDMIGSAAKQLSKDYHVDIITGDKDLLQLIDDNVIVELCQKGTSSTKAMTEDDFKDIYGFPPKGLIELKALMGDTSDNIPGVRGVGEKKGMALIQEYGTISELYDNVDNLPKSRMKEKIIEDKEIAFLSHELATIRCDIDCIENIDNLIWRETQFENPEFIELLAEFEFKALHKEFSTANSKPLPKLSEELTTIPGSRLLIRNKNELDTFLSKLEDIVCIDVETTSLNPYDGEIVGIAIASTENESAYIPLRHFYLGIMPEDQMEPAKVIETLNSAIANKLVICHNAKFDLAFLEKAGLKRPIKVFDTLLAAYLLDSTRSNALKKLGKSILGYEVKEYKEVAKGYCFSAVHLDDAVEYACQDVLITIRLYKFFKKELIEKNLAVLFKTIEMPLSNILLDMEHTGIKLNKNYIKDVSESLGERIKELETSIHEQAGHDFNINSTKQLQEVLFEELQLTPPKKTKTGFSTDSEVLHKLSIFHPICKALIEYRELAKLKSTYADALPELVNKETNLIHASFNQAVTATGRLSSSNPNMQNIPIRTDWGRKIRRAFEPPIDGDVFISIDYSQIELRLLAHFSEDPEMIEAYKNGIDIHSATAAKLFGIDVNEVTKDERRIGKTVNFGIIYGISAHGLSEDLAISRAEAKTYIDGFYRNYPGVTEFFNKVINDAKSSGYVETILGRVRKLDDINSSRFQTRSGAERIAKNTRLQGSAADLVKKAMIETQAYINKKSLNTKIVLQIHDELVFSVPESELKEVVPELKKIMENTLKLNIPLVCDVAIGKNLADLEDWM